jgi:hypothetical protein
VIGINCPCFKRLLNIVQPILFLNLIILLHFKCYLAQIFRCVPSPQLEISCWMTCIRKAPVLVVYLPKSCSSGFWIWSSSCIIKQNNPIGGVPMTMQASRLVSKNQTNYPLITSGYIWGLWDIAESCWKPSSYNFLIK